MLGRGRKNVHTAVVGPEHEIGNDDIKEPALHSIDGGSAVVNDSAAMSHARKALFDDLGVRDFIFNDQNVCCCVFRETHNRNRILPAPKLVNDARNSKRLLVVHH